MISSVTASYLYMQYAYFGSSDVLLSVTLCNANIELN